MSNSSHYQLSYMILVFAGVLLLYLIGAWVERARLKSYIENYQHGIEFVVKCEEYEKIKVKIRVLIFWFILCIGLFFLTYTGAVAFSNYAGFTVNK